MNRVLPVSPGISCIEIKLGWDSRPPVIPDISAREILPWQLTMFFLCTPHTLWLAPLIYKTINFDQFSKG
jgi:hypothetical protein